MAQGREASGNKGVELIPVGHWVLTWGKIIEAAVVIFADGFQCRTGEKLRTLQCKCKAGSCIINAYYGYRRLCLVYVYISMFFFQTYCCPTHRLLAAVTSLLVGAAGAADEAAETAETIGAVAVSMALETEAATPEVEEVASGTVAEEEAEVASGVMVVELPAI